jgi:hypothetical protein
MICLGEYYDDIISSCNWLDFSSSLMLSVRVALVKSKDLLLDTGMMALLSFLHVIG